MILPIIYYGHPILRQKGVEILEVTDTLRKLSADMLETMHTVRGVGLAAQQIGKAIQLTVVDVRDVEHPSQFFLGVREVSINSMMPLVLLNPKITKFDGQENGPEGCLSFPRITAEISRASTIHVSAVNLDGHELHFIANGLLSRAIQHELDHLNGILFIDHMTAIVRRPLEAELSKLEKQTLAGLKKRKKRSR